MKHPLFIPITVAAVILLTLGLLTGVSTNSSVGSHHKKHPTTTTQPKSTTTTVPRTTTTIPVSTTTTSILNGSWWQPQSGANLPWQWYLAGQLSLTNPTEMGTNDKLPSGATAPSPQVYDIDGIENSASTVSTLESSGKKTICYIEVGTAGNYYTAAQEGLSTTYYSQYQTAGDFGSKLSGYPEYFLNINAPSTVSITEAMINQQCAQKGFNGVETDLDETFNNNEGKTGFTITEANEETYMTTLANYMHSLGLAWIIKNPDDVGDNTYANAMYPLADAVITEQCNQYGTCSFLSKYEGHKAIFNAEYSIATSKFCPSDITAGINGALFNQNLNGTRSPCN
jgi:hypothetical protein